MALIEGYSSSSDSEDEHKKIKTNKRASDNTEENSNKKTKDEVKEGSNIVPKQPLIELPKNKKRKTRHRDNPWASWSDSENETDSSVEVQVDIDYKDDELVNRDILSTEKEVSNFYGDKQKDYQGRGFIHPPIDVDIDFKKDPLSFKCFLPKLVKHKYPGHQQGVTALQFIPKKGHLFLSGASDNKLKIWNFYHERECLRDYMGHEKAIKSISFSDDGTNFLSSSYDQTVKLWDTEKGTVNFRLKFNCIPNDISFRPSHPNEIIVGLSNSKIRHYDRRVQEKNGLVQVYDNHLSSILKLCYFPDGSKFISSSEDKTVKIWENRINIPIKHISDTAQHSMPYLGIHPENNYFCTQSMDNSIYTFNMKPKYRRHPKKIFKGHKSAGYGISLTFSPDGKYICSGDSNSNVFIWDWKTTKMLKKISIPGGKPITQVSWHPQETSKVICGGNSGKIFVLD